MTGPRPAPPPVLAGGRRWWPAALLTVGCLGLAGLIAAGVALGLRAEPLDMAVLADWAWHGPGGRFSFRAPPDLRPRPVQGIDSFGGHYVSPDLDLRFDYGWYSDATKYENKPQYRSRRVWIDGYRAKLVSCRMPTHPSGHTHVTAVHFPDLGDGRMKLTVIVAGRSEAERDAALRIFSSLSIRPVGR